MNIEELNRYEDTLLEIGNKQRSMSDEYKKARVRYAELHSKFQWALAQRMHKYRSERSSIGFESAMLRRLEDAFSEGDEKFHEEYTEYEVCRAKYKALELGLQALQNQQTSVQSVMKWKAQGDTYGK